MLACFCAMSSYSLSQSNVANARNPAVGPTVIEGQLLAHWAC